MTRKKIHLVFFLSQLFHNVFSDTFSLMSTPLVFLFFHPFCFTFI